MRGQTLFLKAMNMNKINSLLIKSTQKSHADKVKIFELKPRRESSQIKFLFMKFAGRSFVIYFTYSVTKNAGEKPTEISSDVLCEY